MTDLNFGYDQAEQMDRQREQMEKEQEEDQKKKESLGEEDMNILQEYFQDNIEDYMVDDPDVEEEKFMDWFEGENYHDLLAILNK